MLYVAPHGNDLWSGRAPAPNRDGTDGPFATLVRARDEIRDLKSRGPLTRPVTVRVRGGTYVVPETIVFTPQDSGTRRCPIRYEAYPGETPVLSGGRCISGWRRYRGEIRCAALPDVKAGKWYFRSLFANGERQVRARYPNVDRRAPYRGGFLYASRGDADNDRLCVINVFHAGDWLEYDVRVPADGDYAVWLLYCGNNTGFGLADMSGRTSVSIDGGPAVPLERLPAADPLTWARCARLALTRGRHTLTWRNDRGGLINLKTFALCDDRGWAPRQGALPEPSRGRHRLVIRATDFRASHANELLILPLAGETYGKTRLHYRPGDVKPSWAKAPDAEVHIYPTPGCSSYYMEIARLAGVDETSHTLRVSGPGCVGNLATGNRFFVENVFEELDAPGEWYLDRRRGVLYHWPTARGKTQGDIVAPVLSQVFCLDGVENIALAGLTIRDTDHAPDAGCVGTAMGSGGTVHLHGARNCEVTDCRFANIGKYAVCLDGGGGHVIAGNDVADSAAGGILLLDSAGNEIADNHIHHCGQVYKHVGGVVLQGAAASRNGVAHNAIHDVSRYGIALKNAGVRNRVEFNDVWNVNLETHDTGGIEVTQHDRELRSNSVIRYNLVHDTVGYSSNLGIELFGSWGIYLDSFAGGYTVSHNITYRNSWGGMMFQGGRHNRAFNNILVDGYHQVAINNFARNSKGLSFERNIVHYSGRANLFYLGDVSTRILHSDRNLFWHADRTDLNLMWPGRWEHGDWTEPDFAQWQKAGFDRHSLVADPRFVDPGADDFRLRPGSPAFRLGFEPIDVRQIGLLRKRCQRKRRPALPAFGPCPLRCDGCPQRRHGATPCRHLAGTTGRTTGPRGTTGSEFFTEVKGWRDFFRRAKDLLSRSPGGEREADDRLSDPRHGSRSPGSAHHPSGMAWSSKTCRGGPVQPGRRELGVERRGVSAAVSGSTAPTAGSEFAHALAGPPPGGAI
jgi:parallel beta-helix repeat protein